jgi:hypothetical protein
LTHEINYIITPKDRILIYPEGNQFILLYKERKKWSIGKLHRESIQLNVLATLRFYREDISSFILWESKLYIKTKNFEDVECLNILNGESLYDIELGRFDIIGMNCLMARYMLIVTSVNVVLHDLDEGYRVNIELEANNYLILDEKNILLLAKGKFIHIGLKVDLDSDRLTYEMKEYETVDMLQCEYENAQLHKYENRVYIYTLGLVRIYDAESFNFISCVGLDCHSFYVIDGFIYSFAIRADILIAKQIPLNDPRRTRHLNFDIEDIDWRGNYFAITTQSEIAIYSISHEKVIKSFNKDRSSSRVEFINDYKVFIQKDSHLCWYDILSDKVTSREIDRTPLYILVHNGHIVVIVFEGEIRVVDNRKNDKFVEAEGLHQVYSLFDSYYLVEFRRCLRILNIKTLAFDMEVKKDKYAGIICPYSFSDKKYFLVYDNVIFVFDRELNCKEFNLKHFHENIIWITHVDDSFLHLKTENGNLLKLNLLTQGMICERNLY